MASSWRRSSTSGIAKGGLVIHAVPSCEGRRIHGQSNLRAVRDGTRVLRTIARERVSAASRRTALSRGWDLGLGE
jgi:hypothetical protein